MNCRARLVAPWSIVVFLIGILACDPDPRPRRIYLEDFEALCDGIPCGWERSTGTADQARWVSTIHPGEHGLRLEGEVTVRGPGSGAADQPASTASLSARLAARCDADSSLRLDVLLVDSTGASYSASGMTMTTARWDRPTLITLSLGGSPSDGRVSGVVITKMGSGVCEIGEIVVDDEGDRPPGC